MDWVNLIIGAVVGAIAKEVVQWLFGMVKSTALVATFFGKLRSIFEKHNRAIIVDLVAIAALIYSILNIGWTDERLTGKEILIIGCCFLGLIFLAISLFDDIVQASIHKARKSEKAPKSKAS